MIYRTIFDRFKRAVHKVSSLDGIISDYRPCVKPYFDTDIPEGIIIWLGDGDRLIYIPKEEQKEKI